MLVLSTLAHCSTCENFNVHHYGKIIITGENNYHSAKKPSLLNCRVIGKFVANISHQTPVNSVVFLVRVFVMFLFSM